MLVVGSSPAFAQTTTAPPNPIVRISATKPPLLEFGCEASDTTATAGSVTLARTGSTAAALTVSYHVTGNVEPTPSTVVFAHGRSTATITLTPLKHYPKSEADLPGCRAHF